MKGATDRFAYGPSRLEDLCCELEVLRALSRRAMRLRTDIPTAIQPINACFEGQGVRKKCVSCEPERKLYACKVWQIIPHNFQSRTALPA
jgi:hypothetical protein